MKQKNKKYTTLKLLLEQKQLPKSQTDNPGRVRAVEGLHIKKSVMWEEESSPTIQMKTKR